MLPNEGAASVVKKIYVKPQLATHGSVQQLTEGAKHEHKDYGSNIKLPTIGKGPWSFLDW